MRPHDAIGTPVEGLWILEIQIAHPTRPFGAFYEDLLGLPLVHVIRSDVVPSTGEHCPYVHIFFRMADGSTIAFFEAPELPPLAPPPHAAYDTFQHLAMQVGSTEEVDQWHEWLGEHGVEVLGPVELPPGARRPAGGAPVTGPVMRMLVRVPRDRGLALAAALRRATGVLSARHDQQPVRVQIDPLHIG